MREQTTRSDDGRHHLTGTAAGRTPRSLGRWGSGPARGLGAASIVVTLVLLAACSAGSDDSTADYEASSSAGAGAEESEAMAYDDADAAAEVPDTATDRPAQDAAVGESDGTAIQTISARTGRRIVRTAQLELDVEDAADAADEVVIIAERAGGFVAETDLERDGEGVVRGSITLRVPSAALFATVEELDALAVAVPVKRIDEQDVTAESTDLEARLTNLTAYEIELRELLSDVRETTTRPDDLLTVFERIRSVRAEIDQADARLAVLDDQVALSTIRVSLRPAATAVPVIDPTWAPSETVREALTTTSRALSSIADAAIRFTLTVLPIGLLLAAPAVVAVVVWRRVRGRRPEPPAPVQPPPSAPSGPPAPATT